jgi:hypothetical protein
MWNRADPAEVRVVEVALYLVQPARAGAGRENEELPGQRHQPLTLGRAERRHRHALVRDHAVVTEGATEVPLIRLVPPP